ncbi:MAG TPA: MBL fold metallo-hydrolase [Ramlibacter sp.]|jgi:glyoxylase-like metal-dependent hydrolase (beta-lactamase superfamily II)
MGGLQALLPEGMHVFERGWLSSNNVVLVGPEHVGMVDTGYARHAEQTVAMVRRLLGDRQLDTVANTHLHSDHCGGNAALQDAYPGVKVVVPPGLSEAVRRWDDVALTYEPTGQVCPRFRLDGLLIPGTPLRLGADDWEIHAAPGHDPHSVVLFEPTTRTLISADALWENGFGVVFQELEGIRAFDEVADTLDLIESLGPSVVVPGHGSVFTDVEPALERARSRLAAYRKDPVRHAGHAAKVLLKFKLLEQQQLPVGVLQGWAEVTPYFGIVHQRWFPAEPFQAWISQLLGELVRSGAAQLQDGVILN